jgi:cytoskeletal protein CcmA (bactofilin family)
MNGTTRKLGFRLLLAVTLVFALSAAGTQTVRAMETDNDGHVGADEVVDDDLILSNDVVEMAGTVNGNLIATGSSVTISGEVNGDVIAGGSTVTITGTVNGNVFAAGNEILMDGAVQGSVFAAGNTTALGPKAEVGGNLFAAGFSVAMETGSRVTRDIAVAGYQAILAGGIGRDVRAGVAAFELTGTVGRNAIITVEAPSDDKDQTAFMAFLPYSHVSRIVPVGLHVSSGAVIQGNLDYYSPAEQPSGIQATPGGGATFHYRPSQNNRDVPKVQPDVSARIIDIGALMVNYVFGVIREFLTLVLLGALAVWQIPSLLTRAAGTLRDKPLPSLGWGFLVLVLGLAGLVMAFFVILMLGLAVGVVTLFGLMSTVFTIGFSAVGLSGALFMALAQYGTKLVAALLIGDTFLRLIRKDYAASAFWPLLLGIVIIVLFDAVPILGTLISFFIALFGLGALWLVFRDWRQTRGAKA